MQLPDAFWADGLAGRLSCWLAQLQCVQAPVKLAAISGPSSWAAEPAGQLLGAKIGLVVSFQRLQGPDPCSPAAKLNC